MTFEDELSRELGSRPGWEALTTTPHVQDVAGLKQCADGNNVDIDHELTQLDKSAVAYQAYTEILATKFSQIRSAITGR